MGTISKWLYHKRGKPEYCPGCGDKLIYNITDTKFDETTGAAIEYTVYIYCGTIVCHRGYRSDFPYYYRWTEDVKDDE